MKAMLLLVVLCGMLSLFSNRVLAALYDDDKKDLTKGDLNDQDYWWTKFHMMMLDKAIEQKQPEGRIGFNLVSTRERLDKLVEKYPKHEELAKWKKHADEVNKKIDPNADRSVGGWKPGCPWEESNFAQAWVNYHWGKMLIDNKQISDAKSIWSNVKQNFDILTAKDRLKDYPDDLKKWVEDNKDDVDKTSEELKKK
jgi:hypothetical protein